MIKIIKAKRCQYLRLAKKTIFLFALLFLISCKTGVTKELEINPIKKALGLVPKNALFSMEGYYLWDPSIIKVGDKYHLFCSRWPENTGMQGWKKSEIIRAEATSLFGPYQFKQVVLKPENHPWATQAVHNPKIMKVENLFLLYHLGIPKWQTGFATSNTIEGPWEPFTNPVFDTGNASVVINKEGQVYAVGKKKIRNEKDGTWDYFMEAFSAPNFREPFTPIKDTIEDSFNLLPNHYQLEDPTLWYANNLYNVICNDWKAKATGEEKAFVYYTSKDGLEYRLVSKFPIWSHQEGIPMEDKTIFPLNRLERPQVFLNAKNEVIALMAAALPTNNKPSFIVIRPVHKFSPK